MPAVSQRFLALALVGAIVSLMPLAAPPPARAAEHTVQIADSAFSPATLTIGVGDTVTWRNADDRPHTVTSNDGAFDSGNLDEDLGFSFTFTEPGTYTYRCDYHPDMQATIVVEAAAAPAPEPASGGSTSQGTDIPAAGGGGATATATHAPGHEAGQPDTAVEPPISLAWLAPLLIGLGLVAFAFGLVPPARATVPVNGPTAGWRR
jgi:plastocyanin